MAFGAVLFLLSVALVAWAALAPNPGRFGRRSVVLVAAALVIENLHHVVVLSRVLRGTASLAAIVLIVLVGFGRTRVT